MFALQYNLGENVLGYDRWHIVKLSAAVLAIVGIASLVLIYYFPAAPRTVTFAVASDGSTFTFDGQRYLEILARSHVKLELRKTAGAVENLKLLQDPQSGVQAAFLTGGISDGLHAPGVLSLGLVYNNPFWIFTSSDSTLEQLFQFRGKRIAVGPEGSGTRYAAERILGKAGIDATNTTLIPAVGPAAHAALKAGQVDAASFNGGPRAPSVQSMLRDPSVRLMNFSLAEAFTRMFPDVVRLTLPQGVVNVDPPIPPNDVTLIGTTNKVLVRSDLHPEIVYLLLQAMKEVHGTQGIFQKVGEFPNAGDTEYPMAASAVEFYKNGPSFLQRHLPSWMIVQVERAIAALVTLIAIGLPLFNYAPKVYRGFVEYRLRSIYRRLRIIEAALQNDVVSTQVATLDADLVQLDRDLNNLGVPMQHSDMFFRVEADLTLVCIRLGALDTARPKTSPRFELLK
jgi:TRAP transporter TAXI family solute receptor